MKLEATVTNGAYKFTSGEGSMTVDMEKGFEEMGIPEEGIEELKNMSDKTSKLLPIYSLIQDAYKHV